ncbi:hypothetical protein [Pseudonocardia sediminis]|uniref:hypothetical protein n=1 Tax=Pseudonocardia sediminis TaxID=1397368 RepID=UPI00102A7DB2|nr:hypothetical protein [Pseudonocardia sediminis]
MTVSRMPLGRYGDTRVEPATLFDVEDSSAGPPPDAIEVQFRCPVSLSVMLDGMAEAGLDDAVQAWGSAYSDLIGQVLVELQRGAGYVVDGDRRALAPARLELAAVVEAEVPEMAKARWHAHVYVGATAESLIDGTRWPVDVDELQQSVFSLTESFHSNRLWELAERELGVVWGQPRPGAVKEIMQPPWHEHIDPPERGVCPGPWGPRGYRVLADEDKLRLAVETEARIAHQREQGLWQEPTWQDARAYWDRVLTEADERVRAAKAAGEPPPPADLLPGDQRF